jgi:hypothetical protein
VSSLDLSRLSGPDAVAAMRSYPRRYRSTVLPVPDDDAEELAMRLGPGGVSALDLVVNTTNTWALLGQALHRVIIDDEPVLHAGVGDPNERSWDVPPGLEVRDALDHLADQADELAHAIDRVHTGDWSRTGRLAGGGTVTALDVVRDAVATGSDNLRDIDAILAALRA